MRQGSRGWGLEYEAKQWGCQEEKWSSKVMGGHSSGLGEERPHCLAGIKSMDNN